MSNPFTNIFATNNNESKTNNSLFPNSGLFNSNPGRQESSSSQFNLFNNNPNSNNPFAQNYMWSGSCEPGQLTPEGITMQYQLGKHFDELYRNHHSLLPQYYDPNIVKIRASAKVRTLQSAQAFVQTFYPVERRKSNI